MKTNDEKSLDTATANLLESFSAPHARRSLLKGTIAGIAAGASLGASALFESGAVQAHDSRSTATGPTRTKNIIDIAVTAKRLAVTTYSNALTTPAITGTLSQDKITYLQAALVEEQIHEYFFEALGGKPLASTFSYPQGSETFTSVSNFIAVQQQLKGYFASVFLAAVKELAQHREFRLAQIVAQIACVDAEHRVLGRVILDTLPANNYAYEPVLIAHVSDALGVLTTAGYLSPTSGNSFDYTPQSINYPGIEYRTPYAEQ